MENQYLIPANSKKSILYFGLFNKFDLILFGTGLGITLLLLLVVPLDNLVLTIIAIMPGVVSGFLVLPVPNYHNVLTILKSVFEFYTSRQKYIWKGWCFLDGEKEEK